MDEDDLVRAGMEIVLRPVTDIAADVLGLAGGDWLHERRERTRASLREKTRKILRERDVAPQDASPTILLPLLTAAQDESRDELMDLWARLLAAALDPKRANSVRREFIEVLREMDPMDAVVLQNFQSPVPHTIKQELPPFLRRTSDPVLVSLKHLYRLGCVANEHQNEPRYIPESFTVITPFGRELLKVVRDDG